MKKEITVAGKKIEYLVRKYRRTKSLRLVINSQGKLVASKPWYVPEAAIKNFILAKGEWVLEKLAEFEKSQGVRKLKDNRQEYLASKTAAEELIKRKVAELNHDYKFKVAGITIRNQRTRWGSCSSRGNLNFNYRVIFLPESQVDYIVVHELCHLKEMNHSARFWRLVAQKIPNYQLLRKDLQKQRIALR